MAENHSQAAIEQERTRQKHQFIATIFGIGGSIAIMLTIAVAAIVAISVGATIVGLAIGIVELCVIFLTNLDRFLGFFKKSGPRK